MLKWLTVWIILPLVIVAAVMSGAALFKVSVPPKEHQECLQAAQDANNKSPYCPTEETVLQRGMSDPVAYYTLWITLFTGMLAVIGIGQGILSSQQIALARDEFSATHRPKIVVHSVRYDPIFGESGDTELDRPAATVIFYNTGDSPTIIESITYSITQRRFPLESGINPRKQLVPRSIEIASGIGDFIKLESEAEIRTIQLKSDGASKHVLIGKVYYNAKGGGLRQTGFCRVLERGTHGFSWEPVDNPEYEYCY